MADDADPVLPEYDPPTAGTPGAANVYTPPTAGSAAGVNVYSAPTAATAAAANVYSAPTAGIPDYVMPPKGAPVLVTLPSLNAAFYEEDDVATVVAGTVSGDATITISYQWRLRPFGESVEETTAKVYPDSLPTTNISGATSSTYTILEADVESEKWISCQVTYTNAVGSLVLWTNEVHILAPI